MCLFKKIFNITVSSQYLGRSTIFDIILVILIVLVSLPSAFLLIIDKKLDKFILGAKTMKTHVHIAFFITFLVKIKNSRTIVRGSM